MHRFHHRDFSNIEVLLEAKRGQPIAVVIPTRNEARTIGAIISSIRSTFIDSVPLVDELWVIDSGSDDDTLEIAAANGARAVHAASVVQEHGHFVGKGENLWKALHASMADILCFIDGDLENFSPHFVSGLLGPMLLNPSIDYVKAYYERPIGEADRGGGRVTELLVRPMISLFYPELCEVIQPLSGEYAARRSLLTTLPFPTGYGVEIAHLIDLSASGKLERCAQVDLESRIHRNRNEQELGDIAFSILRTMLLRLQRDETIHLNKPLPIEHCRWRIEKNQIEQTRFIFTDKERPALASEIKAAISEG